MDETAVVGDWLWLGPVLMNDLLPRGRASVHDLLQVQPPQSIVRPFLEILSSKNVEKVAVDLTYLVASSFR